MPNHVTNILTFGGKREDIDELMLDILNEKDEVTFKKVCPQPYEIKNTSSPVRVVSNAEYLILKKQHDIKKKNGTLNEWETLPLTEDAQTELLNKYGVDNWYDWAIKNWGTKWNAYNSNVVDENTVNFETAWSTPYQFVAMLSNRFPQVTITVKYADEDFGHNVGEYIFEYGYETFLNVPEGGSREAIEMAMEITNEDYYINDYIACLVEEELEDAKSGERRFIKTLLTMIVEKELIYDGYPDYILEYLRESAVDNEQFEYASKLRDKLSSF